jgi:osmotically-inducible protein OsmY
MALQDTPTTVAETVDSMVVSAQAQDELRRRIARIKRTIRRQTAGGVYQLKIEVTSDTVLLRGRCASFYCKQKAQHAAMDHLAGETLVNEIQVDNVPR